MFSDILPLIILLLVFLGLYLATRTFSLPKSFKETKESRELIVKQRKKKEELEKLQSKLYDE